MSDHVSVGKNVQEEKLPDCMAFVKIMTGEQFIYDICTQDGQLQYLLPANKRVFSRLAELDPLYVHFFDILDSEDNGLLHYGKRFYEDFDRQRDILLQFLWEKAGWRPLWKE